LEVVAFGISLKVFVVLLFFLDVLEGIFGDVFQGLGLEGEGGEDWGGGGENEGKLAGTFALVATFEAVGEGVIVVG
jgi:hypothetical protein